MKEIIFLEKCFCTLKPVCSKHFVFFFFGIEGFPSFCLCASLFCVFVSSCEKGLSH